MDNDIAELAHQAITQIEAQEILGALKVASYPYMKREAQEKFHRALHKQAFPSTYAKPIVMTGDKLAEFING